MTMHTGTPTPHPFLAEASCTPQGTVIPAWTFRLRTALAGIFLSVLLTFACNAPNASFPASALPAQVVTSSEDTIASRTDLLHLFYQKPRLMLVYGSANADVSKITKAALQAYADRWKQIDMPIKSDKEVTQKDMEAYPLFVLGHPDENKLLQRMLPNLPFKLEQNILEFNGREFADPALVSLTLYPNPLQPNMPINLICGTSPREVVDFLEAQNPFWFSSDTYGYSVRHEGKRVMAGFFDQTPGRQWQISKATHWDFSAKPELDRELPHFRLQQQDAKIAAPLLDSLGIALEDRYAHARKFLSGKNMNRKWNVHVFASTESKGIMTRNAHPRHVENDELYVALAPEYAGFPDGAMLAPLLEASLGKASLPQLADGLAVFLTPDWQAKGWAYWAALLHRGQNAVPLAELLAPDMYTRESPLVRACMAAALVDLLVQDWGKNAFLQRYRHWHPSHGEIRQLEKRFAAHLDGLLAQYRAQFPQRRSLAGLPAYHKGFNFAHEGYQVFNGYISSAASQSLAYTADELFCNATAIIPYTGMPDPEAPSYLGYSEGPGTENDQSIVHCIYQGHQAGLTVLLKPQVWLHRGWPGAVKMKSEAEWQAFFLHYYRWMRHFALLGEIYGADILCAGVEFQEATLARPDDWRNVIHHLKDIYSGPVTYAANWGREFENLKFWDELDFIGLNCYYPLSHKEDASDHELEQGFLQVMDKVGKVAESWKKPVIFTEIGFPSLSAAWQEPHAEAQSRSANAEDQARCYAAMFKALQGREWCQGIYLWKWPAFPGQSRELVRGFTPKAKPAEALVKAWFRKI